MTCPTCGCAIHAAPQTWEIRCSVCRGVKYPVSVDRPDPYVCALCRMRQPGSAGRREQHRAAARKRWAGRPKKAGVSKSEHAGAPVAAGGAPVCPLGDE